MLVMLPDHVHYSCACVGLLTFLTSSMQPRGTVHRGSYERASEGSKSNGQTSSKGNPDSSSACELDVSEHGPPSPCTL